MVTITMIEQENEGTRVKGILSPKYLTEEGYYLVPECDTLPKQFWNSIIRTDTFEFILSK